MANPTIASITTTTASPGVAEITANYPTAQSGDLWVAYVAGATTTSSVNFDPSAGWTTVTRGGGNNRSSGLFYRSVTGSEGATGEIVSVASGTVTKAVVALYRIDAGTFTGVPEGAISANSSTDPPSLSPSFGAVDAVWGVAHGGGGLNTVSSWPTDYDQSQTTVATGGAAADSRAHVAHRFQAVSTDNPATFTINGNTTGNRALTWALEGVSAGGSAIAAISSGYHLRGMR